MFPLAAVGMGLNFLGGVGGLFGANAAQKQAEAAAQQAIQHYQDAAAQEYNTDYTTGQRGLFDLSGTLGDALQSTGRSMGSALAGAGVYNSSATAGALANQGRVDASQIGRYQSGLTDLLGRLRAQTNQQGAQMGYGLALNNMNFARQQQAATAGGLSSMLGNLGQLNLFNTGTKSQQPNMSGTPYGVQIPGLGNMQNPGFGNNQNNYGPPTDYGHLLPGS